MKVLYFNFPPSFSISFRLFYIVKCTKTSMNLFRTFSVEQHKLLHANVLHDRAVAGGFVEAAAARALLSTATTTSQRPTLSVSSASTPLNSKSPFSFFTRLRYRKRDKIKANVEQKIRAVRAAEALDRQTNIRRSEFD